MSPKAESNRSREILKIPSSRMVQVHLAHLLARRTPALVVQHGSAINDRGAG